MTEFDLKDVPTVSRKEWLAVGVVLFLFAVSFVALLYLVFFLAEG